MLRMFHPTGARYLLPLFCLCLLCPCPPALSAEPASVIALPSRHERLLGGFTRPRSLLVVASEVAGRCLSVHAEVGEAIAPDGIFCRLDTTFNELQQASNTTARQLLARQIQHDEAELRRHESLLATQAVSRAQIDQLALQLDLSRLKLAQLETEEKSLRETKRRHQVPAPAGWLVVERMVEPLVWVSPGQPLARVGDFNRLVVPLALSGDELAALHQQDPLLLYFPDLQLRGTGRLDRISPDFDPVSRKTQGDILLADSTLAALPAHRGGLRVELRLPLADPSGAVLLPKAAVTERYEEHWLQQAGPEGRWVRVVVLGQAAPPAGADGDWLRVVSPEVRPGDSFVSGLQQTAPPAAP